MLLPWLFLLLGCPPDTEPAKAPALQCIEAEATFGALAGDAVVIETQAMMEKATATWVVEDERAQPVTAGNCDTTVGIDVMRAEDVAKVFAPSARVGSTDMLREMGALDVALQISAAATGTKPTDDSVARRDTLRTLVGLDGVGVTGKGAGVAVLDAGAMLEHPALAGALDAEQWCHLDGGCPTGASPFNTCTGAGCGACVNTNECTHGSAMTSVIAGRTPGKAEDADEAVGLFYAPGAQVKVVRVLGQGVFGGVGSAVPRGDTARLVKTILWLLNRTEDTQYPVVYLGFALDPDTSASVCGGKGPFRAAVEALAKRRIVVAPAGNDGADELYAPACFDGVLSVAASGRVADATHGDDPTRAATWSNGATTADMLAPGEDVPAAGAIDLMDGSPRARSDYTWSNGTSVAAASVAGAMALAVEAKGAPAMLAKSDGERVACVADTSAKPARLDLSKLASCP